MAQYNNGYSTAVNGSKEPQLDVSAVWDGCEEDEVKSIYSVKGEKTRGEYWLWQSVVAQALQDAASCSNDRKMKPVKAEATAWFSLQNEYFLYVCELAGLSPEKVMARAKNVIADAKQQQLGQLKNKTPHTKKRWKWLGSSKKSSYHENASQKRSGKREGMQGRIVTLHQ